MTDIQADAGGGNGEIGKKEKYLFVACFMALIATAFGFIVRAQIINEWGVDFALSETQKGEILGVGLWPFAITIVLFSLIIDKIGYGRAMVFAFVCHVSSAIITITAKDYNALYLGTFISALGNGTVEAVINPVVATMFAKQKVKWLNILHAGWPGGLVVGGIIALSLGDMSWKIKVGLVLIPTIAYGVMMLGQKFPIHERVAAGVSYLDMLKEVGILGALIIVALMVREVGRVFEFSNIVQIVLIVAIVGAYGAYVKSLGRPLFVILLLIMLPLATTELGTDSWITDLLTPAMADMGFGSAAWVLIYTSFIMMVLRFNAGSIVHRISPLGLLAASSAIAIVGLFSLSVASVGIMIFVAATIYGVGKSFFWPTMLGVVAEQFPKGGALTLNVIAGVGMIGVGVVGNVFIGVIQDTAVEKALKADNPAIHQQVIEEKSSVLGAYQAVAPAKKDELSDEDQAIVDDVSDSAKQGALGTMAIFPGIMLISYIALILYFRSKGGYKVVGFDEEAVAPSE